MIPIILMAIESEADKNKIIRIYEEYRGLMLYIAMQVLKDHALAEDAVSESIEKLIRNLHKVGDISCYKTRSLIVVIVRNTAINIWRKAKRTAGSGDIEIEQVVDKAPIAPDKIVSIEGYNRIVDIINSLPDTYRDVAVLSFLHEYSHSEIAEMLGISYDTVKMRISRAKKTIRKKVMG